MAAACLCLPIHAQSSTSISGTVLDATGAAVRGATVTATNRSNGSRTTVTTDAAGRYSLSSLVPSRYDLRIAAPGFANLEQTGITVLANQPVSLNAALRVGAATTTVQVQAAAPDSYTAMDTAAATRTDTPLLEVPQSVGVVTRSVLTEQDARTLNDALVDVSGVTPAKPEEALFTQPVVRGFPAEVYLDGLPTFGLTETANDPTSLVGAERIEVVKGPTSTVYGGGAGAPLGGLINVVSKRPESLISGFVAMRGGSFSTVDPYTDIDLPLGPELRHGSQVNTRTTIAGSIRCRESAGPLNRACSFTWTHRRNCWSVVITTDGIRSNTPACPRMRLWRGS